MALASSLQSLPAVPSCSPSLQSLPADVLEDVYLLCEPLAARNLYRVCRHTLFCFKECEIEWMARWRLHACFRNLLQRGDHSRAGQLLAVAAASDASCVHSLLAIASSQAATHLMRACLEAGADVEAALPVTLECSGSSSSSSAASDTPPAPGASAEKQVAASTLSLAVMANAPEAVSLLLSAGASARGGAQPHLPMLQAGRTGNPAIISSLMAAGAAPGEPYHCPACKERHCPLAAAAAKGHLAALDLLLSAGADIHALHDEALLAAVRSQQVAAAGRLLEAGANPNAHSGSPLALAAQLSSYPLVDLLLQHGAWVNASADMALRVAAKEGAFHIVGRLLAAGADVHAWGDQPLLFAAAAGHAPVVRLLLMAGAAVHYAQNAALYAAAEAGHAGVVALLLGAGADPFARQESALAVAARRDHVEVLELLLEAGSRQAGSAARVAASGPAAAAAGAGAAAGAQAKRDARTPPRGDSSSSLRDEIWDVGEAESPTAAKAGSGSSSQQHVIRLVVRASASSSSSDGGRSSSSGSGSGTAGRNPAAAAAAAELRARRAQLEWRRSHMPPLLQAAVLAGAGQVACFLAQQREVGGPTRRAIAQLARREGRSQLAELLTDSRSGVGSVLGWGKAAAGAALLGVAAAVLGCK